MNSLGSSKTSKDTSLRKLPNVENLPKSVQVLRDKVNDKENMNQTSILKYYKIAVDEEPKKKVVAVQTDLPYEEHSSRDVTIEDLTADEPSTEYWKTLAETRLESLNNSLEEIEKLKEENQICKEMIEETKVIVSVLQEMVQENESHCEESNSENMETDTN